eukprot:GSChrysophyteH1.ASY1.ANO1.1125.1 assembled CDS
MLDDTRGGGHSTTLWVVKLMVFLDMFSVSLVVPLLSSYFKNANVDASLWGFTSSVYQLAQLCGGVILGAMADSLSKRNILLLSFTGSAVSYLLLGISKSAYILFSSRVLVGLVKQTMTIATVTITEVAADEDARTRHLGHISALMRFAFVVGPGVGALLYKENPVLPCVTAAVIFLVNVLVCWNYMPSQLTLQHKKEANEGSNNSNSKEEEENSAGAGAGIERNIVRRVWSQLVSLPAQGIRVLLLQLFFSFVENAISTRHILNYFESRFGIETYQLGFVQSLSTFVQIGIATFALPIFLKASKHYIGNSFTVVGILCVLLAFSHLMEVFSPSFRAYIFMSMLPTLIFGELLGASLQSMFLTEMPKKDTGKALGVLSVGSAVVGVSAPLYGTLLNVKTLVVDFNKYRPTAQLLNIWFLFSESSESSGLWKITRPWLAALHMLLVAYCAGRTEVVQSKTQKLAAALKNRKSTKRD